MDRRSFLGSALAAVGGLLLAPFRSKAEEPKRIAIDGYRWELPYFWLGTHRVRPLHCSGSVNVTYRRVGNKIDRVQSRLVIDHAVGLAEDMRVFYTTLSDISKIHENGPLFIKAKQATLCIPGLPDQRPVNLDPTWLELAHAVMIECGPTKGRDFGWAESKLIVFESDIEPFLVTEDYGVPRWFPRSQFVPLGG